MEVGTAPMLPIRQPSGARRAASAATQSQSASPIVVSAVTSSWSSPMSRSFIAPPWVWVCGNPAYAPGAGAGRRIETTPDPWDRRRQEVGGSGAAAAPVVDDGPEVRLAPDEGDAADLVAVRRAGELDELLRVGAVDAEDEAFGGDDGALADDDGAARDDGVHAMGGGDGAAVTGIDELGLAVDVEAVLEHDVVEAPLGVEVPAVRDGGVARLGEGGRGAAERDGEGGDDGGDDADELAHGRDLLGLSRPGCGRGTQRQRTVMDRQPTPVDDGPGGTTDGAMDGRRWRPQQGPPGRAGALWRLYALGLSRGRRASR